MKRTRRFSRSENEREGTLIRILWTSGWISGATEMSLLEEAGQAFLGVLEEDPRAVQ